MEAESIFKLAPVSKYILRFRFLYIFFNAFPMVQLQICWTPPSPQNSYDELGTKASLGNFCSEMFDRCDPNGTGLHDKNLVFWLCTFLQNSAESKTNFGYSFKA